MVGDARLPCPEWHALRCLGVRVGAHMVGEVRCACVRRGEAHTWWVRVRDEGLM